MAAAKTLAGTNDWAKEASGYPHDLSGEQRAILTQFVERIGENKFNEIKIPHETTENVACRFLRARKFDLDKAVEMVENCFQWREKTRPRDLVGVDADTICECPYEEIHMFYPHRYLEAPDVDGRPVYIEATGRIDTAGLLTCTNLESLVRYHIFCLEDFNAQRTAEATRRRTDGRVVDSTTTILDLEGMSMGMFSGKTKEFLSQVSKIDQDNYPETLGRMLIINTPTFFRVIWSVIKGWLDPRTVSKITIVGADYKKELEALLGAENVPEEYGGPLKHEHGLYHDNVFHTGAADGRKTFAHQVDVPAGRTLRVRFISRPTSINFGATFTPNGGGDAQVLHAPTEYPDSENAMIEVSVTAPADGKVTLTWNNAANMWQRKLWFTTKVMPTAEELAEQAAAKKAAQEAKAAAAAGGGAAAAGGGGAAE